ncbi:CBO0543 family protein [Halobacillus hunanensis]|uniref:CBO0543 family protein n=1 Tax=Halobacillus hunanensis TaxID=578214 RepID=UPI0009A7EB98|nr:CBO0543 family protein [Halobacillus hunanensis]
MEIIMLRVFLFIGIGLFILALRRPPQKDWLLIYFISAYFGSFIGALVVAHHLISYPVTFLKPPFHSSVLFEFLLLPIVCTYYYQTSYQSGIFGFIWQAGFYSSVLTIIEFFLEGYTDLIEYHQWKWYFTLITVFTFLICVRSLMWVIHKKTST